MDMVNTSHKSESDKFDSSYDVMTKSLSSIWVTSEADCSKDDKKESENKQGRKIT